MLVLLTCLFILPSRLSAEDCVDFRNVVAFEATGNAYHVVTADLNGDSNLDFVVPGTFGVVGVFYGDGTGRFSGPNDFPAGNYPFDVTVGDFNGDGRPDLAVADNSSSGRRTGAQILLNNGDSTFSPPALYRTVGPPNQIVTADFNSDGKLDLALTDTQHGIVDVLLGNGNGTFQRSLTSAGTANSQGIIVGDFNEDGKLDLAISNYRTKDLRILLGDGEGHFTSAYRYMVAGNPSEVALGDFNKDPHQDLAVGVYNISPNNRISVYLGNGDGSFAAGAEIAVSDPKGIAAVDLDNDGDVDLATVTSTDHNLVVALGDGTGGFPMVQSFPIQMGAANALDVAAGDFDEDGRQDVVTAAYDQAAVLLGTPCR